ncbi:MAG: hypothetical protein V1836_04540 [Candidatus Aenigmatarchaeota archaeon]
MELNYYKTCQICNLAFDTELTERQCCDPCIKMLKYLRSEGRLDRRWLDFYT